MPDDPQNPECAPKPSRYQRVKAILNQAQGTASPSYQGYGRFWELPLPEFLKVVIYGVRMIAPAHSTTTPFPALPYKPPSTAPSCCGAAAAPPPPSTPQVTTPSCCGTTAPAAGGAQTTSGRGAASGLVIGLRGQYPFDGTQFPRLPWEGQAVADSDIQLIEEWIDAGCPPVDEERPPAEVSEALVKARARGDEEHPLSTRPANHYHQEQGGVKIRKNINALSPEELTAFQNAVAWMKSFDSYYQDQRSWGYWARIHANNCQHGWEEFLTWHRLYLYYMELELQGYDPTVTLPYWDWTDEYDPDFPATLFDASEPDPAKTDNGIIPQAYRCWLTQQGWEQLKKGGQVPADVLTALQKVVTIPPGCPGYDSSRFLTYNSGLRLFKAAGVSYGQNKTSDHAIMTELGAINPLWHQLRWPGGDQTLIFQSYPSSSDVENVLAIPNFFNFGSGPTNNHFFGALENIHNLIHNFSGGANPYYKPGTNPSDRNNEPQFGDMVSAGVTAYDPIFWGHHSNVDRLWADWESMHPGAGPDNLSSVLPPFPLTVTQTLNVANFGYEYMKSSHVYPASPEVPISRFKSAKTPVQKNVLDDHSRAEVRLHQVLHTPRAGFHIRVFLNSPGADEKTPLRGNPNFVGQLNTFHGHCIGGPGHCDPPAGPVSPFDRRPRHRKTPGQYRIDATDAVRHLRAQGETAFQVNLVVLNTDGTLADDALQLNAVSLNFME